MVGSIVANLKHESRRWAFAAVPVLKSKNPVNHKGLTEISQRVAKDSATKCSLFNLNNRKE